MKNKKVGTFRRGFFSFFGGGFNQTFDLKMKNSEKTLGRSEKSEF